MGRRAQAVDEALVERGAEEARYASVNGRLRQNQSRGAFIASSHNFRPDVATSSNPFLLGRAPASAPWEALGVDPAREP